MDNRREFADWLLTTMEAHKLTQAELARRSGLHRSVINKIVGGATKPTPETLEAIAKALPLPIETVLRAANILPKNPETNELVEQLIDQASALEDEDLEELISIVKVIRERREKYGVKNARKTSPRTSASQS